MAIVGIKGLTTIKFMVPGHWVKIAHFAILVRFFIHFNQRLDQICPQGFEVVELVSVVKSGIQVLRRWVVSIHYGHGPFLYVGIARVTGKIPAHQFVVPGPAVFGIGGGVDAHIRSSRLNVALKVDLLRRTQYIAGSV